MSLPKSAGEPASTVPPRSASCAFNFGIGQAAVDSDQAADRGTHPGLGDVQSRHRQQAARLRCRRAQPPQSELAAAFETFVEGEITFEAKITAIFDLGGGHIGW